MPVVAKRMDGLRCHLVGRGLFDFVLDGTQPPLKKGTAPQCLLWPYGRLSQLLLSSCRPICRYMHIWKAINDTLSNLIIRSSPGDDLVDWNSGVSIRPSVCPQKVFFSDFDLIWCVGRPRQICAPM